MQHIIVLLTVLYIIGVVDVFTGETLEEAKGIFNRHNLTGWRKNMHIFFILTIMAPLHIVTGALIVLIFIFAFTAQRPPKP